MEYAGYLSSIIIGISLGLIGSGGSILTVPVLVYLFSVDAVVSTAYSLFIVGITSAVGSFGYLRKRTVNLNAVLVFGIPSIVAVYFTRAYVVTAIPDEVFTIGDYTVKKGVLLLLLFAVMMIAASYSMIRKVTFFKARSRSLLSTLLMILEGLVTGMVTGLVGAGGGFLIIPALVVLSGLPMKVAVGTSLIIIASKSLIGFMGESSETYIDWPFLLTISAFAILGIFIGNMLSSKIDGNKLKPVFGWFVLAMGIYMIVKETVFYKGV